MEKLQRFIIEIELGIRAEDENAAEKRMHQFIQMIKADCDQSEFLSIEGDVYDQSGEPDDDDDDDDDD